MRGEGPVFVDSNVLIYAFDADEPERQPIARQLLGELFRSRRFRLSTQILQEFYAVVTRKIRRPLSPERALAALADFAAWNPVIIDTRMVQEAARLSAEATISLWDALVIVAASRSGAAQVLTEDLNDGQKILGVEVVNPFRSAAGG